MNYLDIIFLIPILIGAWKGFKKGFIIEVFTFLALFAGIYGAINFTDYISELMKREMSFDSEYLPIIAFIITFLLVGAMVYFLGKMLEKAVSIVALSTFNKFAGLIFGAVKMVIIMAMVVVVIESIDEKQDFVSKELKDESILYQPLKKMAFTGLPAIKDSKLFKQGFNFDKLFEAGEDLKNDVEEKVKEGFKEELEEKIDEL